MACNANNATQATKPKASRPRAEQGGTQKLYKRKGSRSGCSEDEHRDVETNAKCAVQARTLSRTEPSHRTDAEAPNLEGRPEGRYAVRSIDPRKRARVQVQTVELPL